MFPFFGLLQKENVWLHAPLGCMCTVYPVYWGSPIWINYASFVAKDSKERRTKQLQCTTMPAKTLLSSSVKNFFFYVFFFLLVLVLLSPVCL